MSNRLKVGLLAILIVVVTTTTTIAIIYSQEQAGQNNQPQNSQPQNNQLQKIQQRVPVADFNELLPNNIEEKTKREKRNKARNIKFQNPEDAKRFRLTDEMESNYGAVPKHASNQPAIPAKRSAAIIIGEITDAKAYLSEDKVSVYSEFEVSNPEVLKNTTPELFSAEKPAIVSRGGGGVRFPSGKVIYEWVLDKPMPEVGKKYLFFLEYSDEKGFSIITAYELKEGKVFPLDGALPDGSLTIQFKGHQSFKGASETDFLNQVKEAIENNSDIFNGRK